MYNSVVSDRELARFACCVASKAKRAALQFGKTELYMEAASACTAFVKLLLGMLRLTRFLLVTFLCASKEKLPARWMRAEMRRMRSGRVEALLDRGARWTRAEMRRMRPQI